MSSTVNTKGRKSKMGLAKIRKIVTVVEETHEEAGQSISPATRRAAAIAVIENPFAGRFEADLEPLMAIGEELGGLLGNACVAALGISGQVAGVPVWPRAGAAAHEKSRYSL